MYIDFWNSTIYYMSSVHTDICILIIPSFVRVSFLQKTYFWNLIKTDDTFFRAYNKRYLLLLNTSISKCKFFFSFIFTITKKKLWKDWLSCCFQEAYLQYLVRFFLLSFDTQPYFLFISYSLLDYMNVMVLQHKKILAKSNMKKDKFWNYKLYASNESKK